MGTLVATHEGGYTPFEADITDYLKAGQTEHVVVVWADDDPGDLSKPRGKQDWQLEPHSIWYPRTTGIWQSVWLEKAPGPARAELAVDRQPRALGNIGRRDGARAYPRKAISEACASRCSI